MQIPDLTSLFVAPLNKLGVVYMVTGSVASSAYSHVRFTNDIDLVVVLSDIQANRQHQAFDPAAFYVPPHEVINVERQRTAYRQFNLIHVDTGLKADLFFAGSDRLIQRALDVRLKVVDPHGEPVWFAPPEYVILSKLRYMRDGGSPRRIADIRAMLQARGDSLDKEFLLSEVKAVALGAAWDAVQG